MKRLILLFVMIPAVIACFSITSKADETSTADSSDQVSAASQAQPETSGTEQVYPITPDRREMLNKYSNFSLGWSVFYDIFGWILLLAIAFSGASSGLLKLAARISSKRAVQFLIFVFAILLIMSVITLPLDIYRDFHVEHSYNLSNQSFGSWFGDWLKNFAIGYIISALAFAFIYFMIRRSPRRWWLYFSLGATPFIIFLMIIAPVVISPLFNKFQPLQNQELKSEILNLASKGGIGDASIFQVDASKQSKKLNAYVTGLFGTKRIVLYDTIIKALTGPELLFVVAHEMGHYVMHHVWYSVAMIIILLFFLTWIVSWLLPAVIRRWQSRLGFDEITSYASIPLIMFVFTFITFFVQPATNGVSRYFEHQADKYAITITSYNSDAAQVAYEKLSAYNLSDPDPNPLVEFWFYNHPALQKRIDFVKNYRGK